MKNSLFLGAMLSLSTLLVSCGNDKPKETAQTSETAAPVEAAVKTPVFNADSAYALIGKQVAFGPRTPGSPAQKKCAELLQKELRNCCDTVYRQEVSVKGGDGKMLPCINLIGVIHPKAQHRILMLTHWDSRPWADKDTKDKDKPILAADDAGSGVGVLVEMAAKIKSFGLPDNIGVDILFEDVEDYGKEMWGENSYCLGTQYWAHNPHVPGYKADFGILLDMVGAHNALFKMESQSTNYARDVQADVWKAAADAGFSSYFPYTDGGAITDDHIPVNQILGIKTIDIINLGGTMEQPFAPHWHTHNDNMSVIDKNTLKAVGQTLLQVVYSTAARNKAS